MFPVHVWLAEEEAEDTWQHSYIEHIEWGWIDVHGQRQMPTGIAFFCPDCGRVWATFRPETARTYPFIRRCQRHGNGTLWINWENEHNRNLPRYLLKREFALLATLTNSGTESPPTW